MTFQELARNIYEAAQFDRPANQRTVWDNESLEIKLRYQRVAKVAMGFPYISVGDMRAAFVIAAGSLAAELPAKSVVAKWLDDGVNMPALVLVELSHALNNVSRGEG